MRKGNNSALVAGGCLLCVAAAWSDPVPLEPMAELKVHCAWGSTSSEAACTALIDRLEAVERPSRDERLALIWSRRLLRGLDTLDVGEETCEAVEALAVEHPNYADALYYLSFCTGDEESLGLLLRAAEIDPDNYHVLDTLLTLADAFPPGIINPETLAAHRESLYEAARARVPWRRAVLPKERAANPVEVWSELFGAAVGVYVWAMREGDLDAAEAIQARVRRDAGLDALDYGAEADDAQFSLALACHPALYGYLGLEDVCITGIEELAEQTSAAGLPLPGHVVEKVDRATRQLRRAACAASTGQDPWGDLVLSPVDCRGAEATESKGVRRLRAVLEHHGGVWSSEHHRVHAQGFLGDDRRLEGLRNALRADAGNARARCDLAKALEVLGRGDEVHGLPGDADPACLMETPSSAFTWGDQDGYADWLERKLASRDRKGVEEAVQPDRPIR